MVVVLDNHSSDAMWCCGIQVGTVHCTVFNCDVHTQPDQFTSQSRLWLVACRSRSVLPGSRGSGQRCIRACGGHVRSTLNSQLTWHIAATLVGGSLHARRCILLMLPADRTRTGCGTTPVGPSSSGWTLGRLWQGAMPTPAQLLVQA